MLLFCPNGNVISGLLTIDETSGPEILVGNVTVTVFGDESCRSLSENDLAFTYLIGAVINADVQYGSSVILIAVLENLSGGEYQFAAALLSFNPSVYIFE